MDIYNKQIAHRDTGGHGGGRGQAFKSLGKLLKRLDRLAPTNFGSRLRISPFNTPGAFRAVLGGHKCHSPRKLSNGINSLGKLSNGWKDWHQIWFTSADSSGNGHRLNTIRPSILNGAFPRVLEGHKLKQMSGKPSNDWTD